jgi:hypothetical protein
MAKRLVVAFQKIYNMTRKIAFVLRILAFTIHSTFVMASTTWTSLNGPFGYNNSQYIKHYQGATYVSTHVNSSVGTGVWKTLNAGVSWVDVSAGLPKPYARAIEGLGGFIFVACDTGVYSSNNQGASWVAADNLLPNFTVVTELIVHQGELFAALFYGSGNIELFKTNNNGLSWTFTGAIFSFSTTLNRLYSDGNTLWASTTSGVYKSTDGGVTFNLASNNIPFSASINSISAKGDTAYCATSNGTYYTFNGGQMWTPLTINGLSNPLYSYNSIIVGNKIYLGINNNGVYSATLGQNNWTPFGSGFNNFNLIWSFTADAINLFSATTEGIFGCPIPGGSWTDRNGNITRARTTIGWVDNNIVCAGSGFYSGLKRTSNGGATWTNTSINNQVGLYKRAIKINNKILMPSSYTIFSSTDDGQTWTSPTIAPLPNYGIAKYGNYLIAPSGNKVVYSDDLGITWNIYSTGIPTNGTVYSVAVMGQSAYAGVGNSIYRMEYPGAPWVNFSQGIQLNGQVSTILSVENTLIINNGFGLWRRTIEDSLWRSVSFLSYGRDMIYTNEFIFMGTNDGVYFSDDLGKSFHLWNEGFPDFMGGIESLFADGNNLYAGADQFSAWKRTIEPEISITSAPTSTFCTGSSITVSAACIATLNANNKYYLQISDRFGRFLNPLTLDSIQGTSPIVTFNTILPDSLLTGTQYKVRVVSSSPYVLATSGAIGFTIIQRVSIKIQPANQSSCQGQGTGFFVAAAGDSLFYQWEVDQTGSGSYTALSNNVLYQNVNSSLLLITNPTSGINGYRYRCQVSNSCGTVISNFGLLNISSTNASITSQPASTTVCSGLPASFSLTASGSGLSYQWQVNSGFGVFTNISNGGLYSGVNTSGLSINLTTTNMNGYVYRCKIGNCLFSDSVSLEVNGSPVASTSLPQEFYCDGGSAQFSAFLPGANLSYQWEENNGSGFSPVINGPNYSGANSAILQLMNIPASHSGYLYRCNITGLCLPGTGTTNNGEIILAASPSIVLQPANTSVCEGDTATFAVAGVGNLLFYQWEMNTGSGWIPVPSIAPYSGENSGALRISPTSLSMQNHQFRCRLSSCVTTSVASLNINSLPAITAGSISVCSNQIPYTLNTATPNGGIYFGNDIYNGIFNPNANNTGTYVYNYFFQNPNGCSSSASGTIQLSACTDLAEITTKNPGINIYPNPASSNVTVSFIEPVETETMIQIFSGDGRLINSMAIEDEQNQLTVDVTNYSNGIYLIRAVNEKGAAAYRLLVLH